MGKDHEESTIPQFLTWRVRMYLIVYRNCRQMIRGSIADFRYFGDILIFITTLLLTYNLKRVVIQLKVNNGDDAMEYLNRVIGMRVVYRDDAMNSLPNFIHARYRMQRVTLDGNPAIFVYPKEELEAVSAIQKHLDTIARTGDAPAVLIPDHLTYRQKRISPS